ncbi:ATP synthase subunit b [Geobacter sp. OR-1]|uniref:F0F1 ATP synthase subunit B family protein n=1 Tax=Geobacter sp. OR-1 TaxID=1266765 RepID=UPI000541B20F|nr:ATP synthase F0 subunit B' [Geobacter sp. OR-1]GAM11281.1 ATP synthase subunit b [Geobacter sp. OR-1]
MIELNLSFVFQVINFLLLLLILNIFLFKPIRKVLADRESELTGAREKAAAVDKDVADKMAAYEARLKEIKGKGFEERESLKKEALGEEAKLLEAARAEAGATLSAIKQKVAKEATDARAALQEQAKSLSLEICEKVLGRSL